MAHNIWIDENGFQHMFATDRESVWHGLGQRTPDVVMWQDAVRLAGLDWNVVLMPLATRKPTPTDKRDKAGKLVQGTGQVIQVPGNFAVMRDSDGAFLGVVGDQYTAIQNRDAFSFVDSLLGAESGSHYESAGALGTGERIWCLARVPAADFTVLGVDPHQTYLLFTTSHDGSLSAVAKLTDVRVVCQNTLTSALSGNGACMRIKHTKQAADRMVLARKYMAGVVADAKQLQEKLTTLARYRLTRDSMTAILDRIFPKPADPKANPTRRENTVAEVLQLFESNDRNAIPEIRGTAYNLLNAVTEFTDHLRPARITDDRKLAGYTVARARQENAVFGTGDALKSSALAVALEVAAGKPESSGTVAVADVVETEPDAVTPEQQSRIDDIVARYFR